MMQSTPMRMQARASTCRQHAFRASRSRTVSVKAASVQELQQKFGKPGYVDFVEGKGGLPMVSLKHKCGASAEIYLFGATVASWKQASGDEVLYVRPDAVFDKSKPISGGIPHCFPQFGPGKMQQHGFARNLDWDVGASAADPNPDELDPYVELVLTDNDYTRAMFPYKFKATYAVALHNEQLQTSFRVQNLDDKPFDFTAALHTYIEVVNAASAKVTGLKGLTYLDKSADPNNPAKKVEDREAVGFGTALVDSVYMNAPNTVDLEVGTGAAVQIQSTGWQDCVVWNPHLTMAACYDHFVCVENAQFNTPIELAAGKDWSASANFDVVDLLK